MYLNYNKISKIIVEICLYLCQTSILEDLQGRGIYMPAVCATHGQILGWFLVFLQSWIEIDQILSSKVCLLGIGGRRQRPRQLHRSFESSHSVHWQNICWTGLATKRGFCVDGWGEFFDLPVSPLLGRSPLIFGRWTLLTEWAGRSNVCASMIWTIMSFRLHKTGALKPLHHYRGFPRTL